VNDYLVGGDEVAIGVDTDVDGDVGTPDIPGQHEVTTVHVTANVHMGTYTLQRTGSGYVGYVLGWDSTASDISDAMGWLYWGLSVSVTGGPAGYLPFTVEWLSNAEVPDLFLELNSTDGEITVDVTQQGVADIPGNPATQEVQQITLTFDEDVSSGSSVSSQSSSTSSSLSSSSSESSSHSSSYSSTSSSLSSSSSVQDMLSGDRRVWTPSIREDAWTPSAR
jgi:hypothetical protein